MLWAEQTGGTTLDGAHFDVALGAIPLFAALRPDERDVVAGQLRALELAPGSTVTEGGGQMVLVRRGRAQLLLPDLTGNPVPSAELGPGDAFGLAALLGHDRGAVLQALDR